MKPVDELNEQVSCWHWKISKVNERKSFSLIPYHVYTCALIFYTSSSQYTGKVIKCMLLSFYLIRSVIAKVMRRFSVNAMRTFLVRRLRSSQSPIACTRVTEIFSCSLFFSFLSVNILASLHEWAFLFLIFGGTTTQNGPKMDPWNHRNPTEPYNWNRRTLPITEFQALALTPSKCTTQSPMLCFSKKHRFNWNCSRKAM